MKLSLNKFELEIFKALSYSSGVSIALLLLRVAFTGSDRFLFMIWNLFLAWIPIFLAWIIKKRMTNKKYLTWRETLMLLAWLSFLPNSFYLVTDFIHIGYGSEAGILYDVVLMTSFTLSGFLLGYSSLFMVQTVFKKLTDEKSLIILSQAVLLLCSFAIYLGRFLRWNTWDVIVNPAGLVFDVSERILNPGSYKHTFVITFVIFVLLSSTYTILYRISRAISTVKAR